MTDHDNIIARIEATFPADYRQDFGEGDVFRLILDEEGPQALVKAILDATAPTPANEPHNQWTIDDGYLTDGDQLIDPHDTDAVLAALNAGSLDVTAPTGATGHDTPAPTTEQAVIDAARDVLDIAGGTPEDYDRLRAAVAAVESTSGRTATPDPDPLTSVMEALVPLTDDVALRVLAAAWNRVMNLKDEALGVDADPDLPPGVERDGDGWKLRRWQTLSDDGWEWQTKQGTWNRAISINAFGDRDVPVRPVASITEEPTEDDPTGPTGHDTPAPTADEIYDYIDVKLGHKGESPVNTYRIQQVLDAVEALSGRTATPDPGDIVPVQHTEQVPWHAASGRRLAGTGRRIWQVNFGDAGEVFYRLESPDGRRQYASYDADDGMVEVLSGRTATPDPATEDGKSRPWCSECGDWATWDGGRWVPCEDHPGASFVEVSSGSENRHVMKHLPPDQDPVLPPGVERAGVRWVLRKGNRLFHDSGWERQDLFRADVWHRPGRHYFISHSHDVPVRPVASITEEPTEDGTDG